ncbi:MAG: hypothetical protein IKO39_04895, partial [Treponema sp.]|nr:hypothetical protein [Treponema sp.]
MILYINSCVRPDSRTNELARHLLKKAGDEPVQEVNLQKEKILPLDWQSLTCMDKGISSSHFDDEIF